MPRNITPAGACDLPGLSGGRRVHGCPASKGSLVQAGHAWGCAHVIVDTKQWKPGFVCQDYTIVYTCKASLEMRNKMCSSALHCRIWRDK